FNTSDLPDTFVSGRSSQASTFALSRLRRTRSHAPKKSYLYTTRTRITREQVHQIAKTLFRMQAFIRRDHK
ncbi:MAG TPA: hypothetical protein PKA21_09885, partial [Kiritimatiellia bacterium]|nr:hypothetical protein [Kiritimatiellia bacterium]